MNINNLPPDLLVLLALELNISDVFNFCKTNKRFNKYVCENNNFWRRRFHQDFLGVELLQSQNPKERYSLYKQLIDKHPKLKTILPLIKNPLELAKYSKIHDYSYVEYLLNGLDIFLLIKIYKDWRKCKIGYFKQAFPGDDSEPFIDEVEKLLPIKSVNIWDMINYIHVEEEVIEKEDWDDYYIKLIGDLEEYQEEYQKNPNKLFCSDWY